MKRFFTLLLSLTLLVVISACRQSAQNGETAEKNVRKQFTRKLFR